MGIMVWNGIVRDYLLLARACSGTVERWQCVRVCLVSVNSVHYTVHMTHGWSHTCTDCLGLQQKCACASNVTSKHTHTPNTSQKAKNTLAQQQWQQQAKEKRTKACSTQQTHWQVLKWRIHKTKNTNYRKDTRTDCADQIVRIFFGGKFVPKWKQVIAKASPNRP